MARRRVHRTPEQQMQLAATVKGYAVNQMNLNWWRLRSTMERDDFMQEAYIVFMKCIDAYPRDSDREFMGRYKVALRNRVNDLAIKDTKHRAPILSVSGPETRTARNQVDEQAGDLDNDGYLMTLVRQAPPDVKRLLYLLLTAPPGVLERAMRAWRAHGHIDPGGNRQMATWLGLEPESRPLDDLREYLSG